jgi:hypothetical protein
MRYLLFILCCLLSFNTYGQKSFSDSLHTHNHINYNLESHRNSTTFKYVGRAISILGAFSSFQNIQNGADQDKLNTSAAIIAAGGLIGLLADISQDVEEVKLGEIVSEHITQKVDKDINSTILPTDYDDSYDSSINDKEVVLIGPLSIDSDRELTYTDKKGNKYLGHLLYYNINSNCYVLEYVKNGRQKTISIYENRHHRLSQE